MVTILRYIRILFPLTSIGFLFLILLFIPVTESIALDNSTLNGTYAYVTEGSGFHGSDPNGGFGANDEEAAQRGEFTFDGTGGCTDTGTEDSITRNIGETGTLSNRFTTINSTSSHTDEPCSYNVLGDGTLTFTYDPGTPDERSVTGTVSTDGNTLSFGSAVVEPGNFLGTHITVAVKKGSGLNNSTLNGTYAYVGEGSGFDGSDPNGGFGANDEKFVVRGELTFDGTGGCTDTGTEDSITRNIGETGTLSNRFTTTNSSDSWTGDPCTYNVAGDGALTITFEPGTPFEEIITGTLSADGNTALFAGVEVEPGNFFDTQITMAVKKGIGFNNSTLNGTYPYLGKGSGFTGSDPNGGFGANDEELADIGEFTFDGTGGCTETGTEDFITRNIGETGTLSNRFTTTNSSDSWTGDPCTYNVAGDGALTITFEPGTPFEEIITGTLSADGNTAFFVGVEVEPGDFFGTWASVMFKKIETHDDLIVDFGAAGVWVRYNDSTWTKLHPSNSDSVTTGDMDGNGLDDVIIDFGASGVWVRQNNTSWTKLHASNPDSIATGDMDGNGKDEVIIDFGVSGVWIWQNNTSWTKLHASNPDSIATGDMDGNGKDDVIIDFGASGVWIWQNNTSWTKLHASNPDSIAIGDMDGNGLGDVIIDFGASGVWVRQNNTSWTKLHASNPDSIATGDMDGNGKDDVIIDFGASGVWIWQNNTSWTKLHASNPDSIATGDMDGSGQDEVIIDFASSGLWVRYNNASWTKLHSANAGAMTTGNIDGN